MRLVPPGRRDDGEDPLRPARGFRNGTLISIALWAIIIIIIRLCFY